MNRREALRRVALLMGGTLSSGTVAGVLGGCGRGPRPDTFQPRTLSRTEAGLVATLSEIILPETDTPGARAAGVHMFIDDMLTDWFDASERNHFLEGLSRVNELAAGGDFLELSASDQVAVMRMLEREALAHDEAEALPPFFEHIKSLTVLGYYTSEAGATQELRVMPMGIYRGEVSFEEIGRTWA